MDIKIRSDGLVTSSSRYIYLNSSFELKNPELNSDDVMQYFIFLFLAKYC